MRYAARAFLPAPSALVFHDKLDQALEVARGGEDGPLPVLSVEPFDHSGARKYAAASFASLCAWMERMPARRRRAHEFINPDVECKFVADLDLYVRDAAGLGVEDGEAALAACLQELGERLQCTLGLAQPPVASVATASRPDKFSWHVVYPALVLRNWASVAALGDAVLRESAAEKTLLHHALDANVYARASGTLRTLFSTGFNKPTWFVPHPRAPRDPDGSHARFAAAPFLEFLATFVPRDRPPFLALPEGVAPQPERRAFCTAAVPDAFRDTPRDFAGVLQFMSAVYADAFFLHRTFMDNDEIECTPTTVSAKFRRFPCAAKGGLPHRSNRVVVTWAFPPAPSRVAPLLAGVSMWCMNASCGVRRRWDLGPAQVAALDAGLRGFLREEAEG